MISIIWVITTSNNPTNNINADGSVSSLSLFDGVASNFSDWRVGQNELVIAIRNPDTEGAAAGGLAFRLGVHTGDLPSDELTTLTSVTSDPSQWTPPERVPQSSFPAISPRTIAPR